MDRKWGERCQQWHKDVSVLYQRKSTKAELLCKSLLSRWKGSKYWAVRSGTRTDAMPALWLTNQSLLNWSNALSYKQETVIRSYYFTLAQSASLKGRAGWGGAPWQVAWKLKPGTAGTKSGIGCERTAGSQAHWELHLKVGWSNTEALIPLLCSFFLFPLLFSAPNISNKFTSELMLKAVWETLGYRTGYFDTVVFCSHEVITAFAY